MKHSRAQTICASIATAGLSAAFLYPFLWMFLSGFKSNAEIYNPTQLFPSQFNTAYYGQLLDGTWIPFLRVFANSLFIALAQATGAVAISALAGYAFAKNVFPARRILFIAAVTVIVIPKQALAIPLFTWINSLGLIDSLFGVVFPGLVSGLGILYFTQTFRQLPQAYVDVARLSGASEFRVFITLLPLVSSALLSFGLIHFILAWHEHLIPLLVLDSENNQTLPLALAKLYAPSTRSPQAVLMAASTLTLLPTAILFGLLYKRFKTSLSEILT